MNVLKMLSLAIWGLFLSTNLQAGTVVLDVGAGLFQVGDSFSVTVRGEGFNTGITGGGFDLDFNPDVLELGLVTINTTIFNFGSKAGTTDNDLGELRDLGFGNFFGDSSVSFLIATLDFTATGAGVSALDLTPGPFNMVDELGTTINDSATFVGGSVTVTAIPLPAAVWLLLGAVGLLGATRRHRT